MNEITDLPPLGECLLEMSATATALCGMHERLAEELASPSGTDIEITGAELIGMLDHFAQLEMQRREHLRAAGLEDTAENMHRLIETHGALARDSWQRLLDVLPILRDRNTANAMSLSRLGAAYTRALDVLRGSPSLPSYNPSGQSTTVREGRDLGSA
ncbi:MAG: flagellar export chaperone FlgN [Halothiobacillaceae bacterium]|jgi:flagellar biosynthesis/type III secretory pathway chaperone|nr:flagellar export chaperone FlgN [Halothiobacillaceae bacterium]MDY0050094.1 flagellar export chaperone FlgN [Halothiobacillaceae bacterium]